jgi:serine/threonine protein kinase
MDKIGPYQIVEVIHRGPQPLFRARAKDGHEVAIKAVPVADLTPETRERFTREAETCRRLEHPNLIRVFEMGEADGMLFQAMEMLEGADLGKVMAEGRHFTWDVRLAIMEQVSSGLQYAHEHDLVHRDIKPANLFLETSGRVRVLDFGMVHVADSELTKVGSSLGTLNYMSPEQIRGERCTPATDVFSAAIVFYQLAAGRHPFSARDRSLGRVVSAIVFETPPKLSELAPDAPEGLEFILDRALEKDPATRLQNAGDLKQAISLCRTALHLTPAGPPVSAVLEPDAHDKTRVLHRPPPAAAPVDEGKTRVMLQVPSAPTAPRDDDKTRVMRADPPVPVDDGKTKVLQRPSASPVAPPPAPPKLPPAAARPVALPVQQFRYCPSCTFANPPHATECERCQTPFSAGALPAKSGSWPLYLAIAIAVLLAIALIVVLILK